MTSIISVKNLKKTYQQRTVVDNLSFDVEEGSLFSFWDPMEPVNQQQSTLFVQY